MSPDRLSRHTLLFVNIAHALDHFVLLIYPTAVIAIAATTALPYGSLLGLATGAFVALGLCSLPMGWLADRFGRRTMLAVFFFGYGLSCLGLATAGSPFGFSAWLLVLGVASAIYHPVGSTMLVTHARRLGRDLGVNGVWGNLGAASASGVTAVLTATFGWKAAFILPGVVCLAAGAAFLALVPGDGEGATHKAGGAPLIPVTVFGALTQLLMGRLVDRFSLPTIFVVLALLQPLGLGLAAATTGWSLMLGLVLAMAAIYGQVVVNDAMVARYVPAQHRSKAFSVRYFLGFTVSGLAVPLIALLHPEGGFMLVLSATALFGGVVFASALVFYVFAQPLTARSDATTASRGDT